MSTQLLVVDDSATIRTQVRVFLSRFPEIAITDAADGSAALTALSKQSFDAIVTDLNMPVLDGFGLISAVREMSRGEKVPIIVLTTRDAETDIDRAFELGANSFLPKPLNGPELVKTVCGHLGIVLPRT